MKRISASSCVHEFLRFRATLYPCPETQAERREMAIGVMTRIEDLNTVSDNVISGRFFFKNSFGHVE